MKRKCADVSCCDEKPSNVTGKRKLDASRRKVTRNAAHLKTAVGYLMNKSSKVMRTEI